MGVRNFKFLKDRLLREQYKVGCWVISFINMITFFLTDVIEILRAHWVRFYLLRMNRFYNKNPKEALELLRFFQRRYIETNDSFYAEMISRTQCFLKEKRIRLPKDCGREVAMTVLHRRGVVDIAWL